MRRLGQVLDLNEAIEGEQKAADDFSAWVVDQGMADFAPRMKAILTPQVITNPFSLLAMSGLGYLLGAVQWVLGFIRQAGLLVLAALLPLAASGSMNESTKPWLNRMLPWLLTLVLYRPMAALIYMIGLTFLGTANDVTTVMTGLMVLALAVIAMPAMLRFFSWAGVSLTGGGGAAMAGAIGAVSLVGATSRTPAKQHANYMAAHGPGSSTPPAGAASSGGPSSGPVGPGGAESGRGAPGAAGQQGVPGAGTASRAADSGSSAAAATGNAAAAGPPGAAAAAGIQAAQWTRQAAQGTADRMTGGEGRT